MPVWSGDLNEHVRDALLYGLSAGTFSADGFSRFARDEWFQRPPLHGAVDFAQGADGVWRIPQVWADGDTIYFGIDLAQPGSDFTAYTVWSRT